MKAQIQISRVHNERDVVHISIITAENHLRVEMTVNDFAETLMTARKIEGLVIRNEPKSEPSLA